MGAPDGQGAGLNTQFGSNEEQKPRHSARLSRLGTSMTGLPEDPTRCATIIAAVLGTVFSEHVVRPRIGLHAMMAAYAP